jgi:L-iditol 2-dehydrogenase
MFALPDDLNLDVAALAEPLGCALKGIEDVRFQPGASLLVIGDGPMGQLVAAAARSLGAYPVIMAGMLEHRLKIARDYFADIVVDITKERLQNVVANCTDQRGADVVLVTVSSGDALAEGIAAVRPGGAVNAFAGVPDRTYIELDIRKLHYKQYFLTGSSGVTPTHMEKALQLLSAQHVEFARIITADFPFPHVAEAVNYVENRLGLKAIVTF